MKFLFIFSIGLILSYFAYPLIKKLFKEKLVINKDLGILNNKYVINFKDLKVYMIDMLKIAIQKNTGDLAIVDLKISIFTENEKLHITEFNNSMKILAYLRKYNIESFNLFINKFFNGDTKLKNLFEKELENENTWY